MLRTHTTWFLVVLASSVAVVAACRMAAYAEPAEPAGPHRHGWRLRLGVLGGCLVVLLALAFGWRARGIAELDGGVVANLVGDRNPSLNGIFSVITTMGDVVPSFLIASLLAVLYYQQTGRVRGLVLVLLVVVQLVIQTAMTVLFNDVTMTDLDPSVPLGGSGTIPSGSVSRLLAMFLVAATLWHGHSPRSERVLLSLAPLLVLTEIVSRLYLGRHLLVDIAGGLLLGVTLTVAFRWVVHLGNRPDVEPGDVERR